LIYAVLALMGLISLIGGIVCLISYAKTRKTALLVVGLLLTFIVPGIAFCIILAIWIPSTMVVYAPPPPDIVP
jgi:hypothetical protein